MTPARSFLLDQLTVTPLDDGQVAVTVTLPPELVKDYCRFLESLAGFFQVAHRKSRLALVASRATSQTADLEGTQTRCAPSSAFGHSLPIQLLG